MKRKPFTVHPSLPLLARIPLLPLTGDDDPAVSTAIVAEGTFLATRQVEAAGAAAPNIAGDRLRATLRGYEIRARSRTTPQGVFAGVALARLSPNRSRLRMGSQHRARTNPSAEWLAVVRNELLDDPGVVSRLILTTNNLVVQRGDRLECEQPAVPGSTGPNRITVRATQATMAAMTACATSAPAGRVFDEVAGRWPQVPGSTVWATIVTLIRGGFLLTDFLPSDVSTDPLRHVRSKLPAGHPMCEALGELRLLLRQADDHVPGAPVRRERLAQARSMADALCRQERPLVVDVAADAEVILPASLVDEAARAAGVLWRVAGERDALADYHHRFLDRYGPHRFVPLLEVTDPAVGLGLDHHGHAGDAADRLSNRARVLTGLLTRAAACGQREIVLDEPTVAALASDQPPGEPPHTAEIYVHVIADNPHGLADGQLRLAVRPVGGSQHAGATLGRFASLLGISGNHAEDTPVLVAELAVQPRSPAGLTLIPGTDLAAHRIPVGVPVRDTDLTLVDLHLVSDGACLALWSRNLGRQVRPVLYSRLTSGLLPPLARFLQLVGQAGCRPWQTWSWAPVNAAFQPRVRYRRTLLAPARWTIPAHLAQAARDHSGWDAAMDTWRTQTAPAPPDIVVTDDADRNLPLDLRHAEDRELLRRYVGRGLPAVTEQLGGPDATHAVLDGPTGRHMLELAIPLARATPAPAPAIPRPAGVRRPGEGVYLPGGSWLSLALRSPVHCQDELLATLADLATDLHEHWDTWFWLRFHTTELGPHLRVRFHGDPAVLGGHVLPAVSTWCQTMIGQRLCGGLGVETYDQEIERYGGPGAITAAENVFATDSRLVLATLASDDDHRITIATLSAAAIARTVADGDLSALHGRHLDRTTRQHRERLRPQVRAHDHPIPPALDPDGRPLWAARHEALAAYRQTLTPALRAKCASSLIHMHTNRAIITPGGEPLVRALAADLLARPT